MFADRLKELTEHRPESKRQISRDLGMSHTQLGRYISGENEPTVNVVLRFANYFGVSTDYLLGVSDDPTPRIGESNLSPSESEIITLLRQGRREEAIKSIFVE